jgi:hypothetical protein
MAFAIPRSLWAYVASGLGIALLASVGFGWLQTERLGSARDLVTSLRGEVALLTQRVQTDAQLITSRDALIDTQNRAVLAMQQAADADRAAYKSRIAAAEKLAKVQSDRAADIMARQASSADELERSREALRLIQEMVVAPQE